MQPLLMTSPVVFVLYVSCFVLFVSPGYAIREVVFNSLVKNISGTQQQTVSQKVRSRVECAVTCAAHQNCSTFMFDRRTNGCFLSDSEDIGFLNPVYVLRKKPAPTDQSTTTSVVSPASADLTTSTTESDASLTSVVAIETTSSVVVNDTASEEVSTTFTLLYTGGNESSTPTKESITLATSEADSVTTIPEMTTSITESETTTIDTNKSVSTAINNVAMTSATSLITVAANPSPTSTPPSGTIAETSTIISEQTTSSFDSITTSELASTSTTTAVVAEQTTEATEPTTSIMETTEATTLSQSTTGSTGGTIESMSTTIEANASEINCPESRGYTMLPIGVCIKHYSAKEFRNQAAAVCVSDGGHLLLIENEAVHLSVRAYLYNISSGHVWVDGYDADMDNTYTSWRGSDLQYIKWMPNNPTDLNRICLGLHANENFDFNDLVCDQLGQFVCQIDSQSPSTAASASSCPVSDGYFMFSVGLCMKYFTSPEIWNDAASICTADGGHLLLIENAIMHAEVKTYLKNISSGSVWIDGFDADKDNVYKSWNGTELPYTKWAPNNPDNVNAMCIGLTSPTNFAFADGNCLNVAPFICQIEI